MLRAIPSWWPRSTVITRSAYSPIIVLLVAQIAFGDRTGISVSTSVHEIVSPDLPSLRSHQVTSTTGLKEGACGMAMGCFCGQAPSEPANVNGMSLILVNCGPQRQQQPSREPAPHVIESAS